MTTWSLSPTAARRRLPEYRELPCALPVGFLHEARDANPLPARSPALDVAVAGLGAARDHAEGDELPGLRGAERRAHRLLEGRDVPDQVIGRQHQQHRTGRLG